MAKIVVAEDNVIILHQISKMLELEGYQVFEAFDGQKCLDLVKSIRPDLIICDIAMPVVDGFGVIGGLKNEPELSLIPIIFLTADANEETILKAKNLGVSDYITKPFVFIDLKGSIEKQFNFLGLTNNYEE
jgi:CheY-like chemotaxis protein